MKIKSKAKPVNATQKDRERIVEAVARLIVDLARREAKKAGN
ncbi:hypothetical protein ACFL6E_05155 [Candidatus Neomarinimicrobiota bacterium]